MHKLFPFPYNGTSMELSGSVSFCWFSTWIQLLVRCRKRGRIFYSKWIQSFWNLLKRNMWVHSSVVQLMQRSLPVLSTCRAALPKVVILLSYWHHILCVFSCPICLIYMPVLCGICLCYILYGGLYIAVYVFVSENWWWFRKQRLLETSDVWHA